MVSFFFLFLFVYTFIQLLLIKKILNKNPRRPNQTKRDKMVKPFSLVVAACRDGGIGKDGRLPWPQLRGDMRHFFRITRDGPVDKSAPIGCKLYAVIMGRKTWTSIPESKRPLQYRLNVVVSRTLSHDQETSCNVVFVKSLEDAFKATNYCISVVVIGGAHIFRQVMSMPECQCIDLTRIVNDFECDTFMPPIREDEFELVKSSNIKHENGVSYCFLSYERITDNKEETQYLQLVKDIMVHGVRKSDRTNTGILSKFGAQLRFSLHDGRMPLLTTKRTWFKGVAAELLWILSGSTDATELREQGVRIWDGNTSREFLDSRGLTHLPEGDIGAGYGHQLRHFGAEYKDCHTDYTGQGVDQLAELVRMIRTDPNSRRMVVSLWNPAALSQTALPPCHVLTHWTVQPGSTEEEPSTLSCHMFQRSCDVALGLPFNIASYALLTHLVAHVVGMRPGCLVLSISDAHIYLNHMDGLRLQLERRPYPFPKLRFHRRVESMDDFKVEDFEIEGYRHHPKIDMAMAV